MDDVYDRAAKMIDDSDRVVITAANGLSMSEGINLFAQDEEFIKRFPWIVSRYGFHSIIQTLFSEIPENEKWAFWCQLIGDHILDYKTSDVMSSIMGVVSDKDPIAITTNGEGHFVIAGIPEDNVFEIEGNWRTMQCSVPCHNGIYPSLKIVSEIRDLMSYDGHIPDASLPRCPRCGKLMKIRMQSDMSFVQDKIMISRLNKTLEDLASQNVTVMELGVGPRNRMIKGTMMEIVAKNPSWNYITVNSGQLMIPGIIESRSIGIDDYILHALEEITSRRIHI